AAVVDIIVQSLSYATDLHAIQDIEELDDQLRGDAFAKEEMFGKTDVLVCIKRVAQLADDARFIPWCKSGIGESRSVEDRQPLVIVVVIHFQGNAAIEIGTIESILKRV